MHPPFQLREALRARRLTVGSWIQVAHPAVAEILANAGFDWIALDCEHTEAGISEFASLARAMHGRRAAPLARVRENDTLAIRQVLDLGAQGVIVPLVNSAQEARQAVAAAKYPPAGVRGFCFSRMNDWGVDFEAYARHANDTTAIVAMIESKEAVADIEAILAVDGLDAVLIGPYDLSGSYGVPGDTSHPLVLEARVRVLTACDAAGKAAGMHVVMPEADAVSEAIAEGFTFLALGVDIVFLNQGARAALAVAKEAERRT